MLEDGSASAVVNAFTVKLPGFWSEEPAMWFMQAESQFTLRSITVDETKFHHVVAALDQATAKRVTDIFLSPPDGPKYEELKKRLLSTFSLTCYQRAQRLLRVSPLGDRRPSELMDEMLALLGQHEPCFLFRTIFMEHLLTGLFWLNDRVFSHWKGPLPGSEMVFQPLLCHWNVHVLPDLRLSCAQFLFNQPSPSHQPIRWVRSYDLCRIIEE